MVTKINKQKKKKIAMDKDFFAGIKFGLGFIFIISMLAVVSASGWHIASEILSGEFAGDYNFTGDVNFTGANVIGLSSSGLDLTNSNVIIGDFAGQNNIGTELVQIGYQAGKDNQKDRQVALGYRSGEYNNGSVQIAIGQWAGFNNSGLRQLAIGDSAGFDNTGGWGVNIGYEAGRLNSGHNQVAIGVQAGGENYAHRQIAIGSSAGYYNFGQYQIAIGDDAGNSNIGNYSIGIGFESTKSNTGNNVVAIGYQAGKSNALDNQFIVQQANVNAIPLIQGDFSKGSIGINTSSPTAGLALDVEGKVGAQELCDETGANCFDVSTGWTVNSNAATLCANGEFLNGDGTCDAGYLDADGVDAYNSAFDTEAEIDAAVSNNGYSTGAHTTDTNANTLCSGTNVYLDGDGNCDTISASGDITGVTAGNGLTGGGASGSVTLHVGAGTGISVAANTVGLSTASGNGHCTASAQCSSSNWVSMDFQGGICTGTQYICQSGHCIKRIENTCG